MLSFITEESYELTSNRSAIRWTNKVNHIERHVADWTKHNYDEEVSVIFHACVIFAINNHTTLHALRPSDVEENDFAIC